MIFSRVKHCKLHNDQPALWRRTIGVALALITIGIPLFFPLQAYTKAASSSIMNTILPLEIHAAIFCLLGVLIIVGGYRPKGSYALLRITLAVTLGFMMTWLLALLYGAVVQQSSLSVLALWAYSVYTIYILVREPGFVVSEVISQVRKNSQLREQESIEHGK
jgi:hypothetical protein